MWNQNRGKKENNVNTDTGRFIVYMKTEEIYSDIAKYVKTRFDTTNYELERPLPKGKNKKAMVLVKNELREK